jgi:hypothetical protein
MEITFDSITEKNPSNPRCKPDVRIFRFAGNWLNSAKVIDKQIWGLRITKWDISYASIAAVTSSTRTLITMCNTQCYVVAKSGEIHQQVVWPMLETMHQREHHQESIGPLEKPLERR